MSKKLLTLSDLENFYANRKKSFHFNANDDKEAIAVQVEGTLCFNEDKYDATMGLLPVHLQSCHLFTNRNRSSISEEVMNNCKLSIHNRPILGFIHQLSNGDYDFAGHEMKITPDGEIEYEEIAIGIIPESCNEKLVYDEDKDKTYLEVDGYIFEGYSKADEILKRKKESKVSVELSLLDFSYNAQDKSLQINEFVFTGVTILGVSRDGSETPIEEGMYGSNIKLKDFSQSNNSIFSELSEEENSRLIETLEKLNNTLSTISNFNINKEDNISSKNCGKEEHNLENNIEVNEVEVNETEEITEVESTEVVETENEVEVTENESAEDNVIETESETNDETPDVVETEEVEELESENNEGEAEELEETESFDEESEDTDEENVEVEVSENESTKEEEKCKNKKDYTKTFSISHEDTKYALYTLLEKYEQEANDYFFIVSVYNDKFVYQSCVTGNYFGQKYTVDGDNISFDGNSYELYAEFLTSDEKASLDAMRSNYSSIQTELNSYKDAEVFADKMTVFEDEAYSAYLETKEFKSLMSEESVKQFSKEELAEKADAALGKVVKTTKNFAMETKKEEVKKPSFFAFARQETQSSFLDGLLKK